MIDVLALHPTQDFEYLIAEFNDITALYPNFTCVLSPEPCDSEKENPDVDIDDAAPLTFFAPTNEAFRKLSQYFIDVGKPTFKDTELNQDTPIFRERILREHILEGAR